LIAQQDYLEGSFLISLAKDDTPPTTTNSSQEQGGNSMACYKSKAAAWAHPRMVGHHQSYCIYRTVHRIQQKQWINVKMTVAAKKH
jgi:hypothetical protein